MRIHVYNSFLEVVPLWEAKSKISNLVSCFPSSLSCIARHIGIPAEPDQHEVCINPVLHELTEVCEPVRVLIEPSMPLFGIIGGDT